MSARSWERLGAVCGLLFFVVLVVSFSTPDTPDADDPSTQIAEEIADDRTGLLFGVYLAGLASLLFLVFVAALWTRLRASELERGPSLLVLLGGLGTTLLILASNGVTLAVIEAADEGRESEAVRALFELDELFFLGVGWTSAAFYLGVALSALATGALPRVLGWLAAVLAATFPIAFLGIFSESEDGGVLGAIFFIALLVNFLWILATSIVMLRGAPARAAPERLGPPD
jgi:hypothetical protein